MTQNPGLGAEDLRETFVEHLYLALMESLEEQQSFEQEELPEMEGVVLEKLNLIWEKFKNTEREGWITTKFEVDPDVEDVLALAGFLQTPQLETNPLIGDFQTRLYQLILNRKRNNFKNLQKARILHLASLQDFS